VVYSLRAVRIPGGNTMRVALALTLSLFAAPASFAANGHDAGNGGGHHGSGGFKEAPEPLTLLGLAVGAGGIALLRRRRSS
jgi:hypothetical protein